MSDLNLDNGIEVVPWNIEFFPKQGQRTSDSVYNIIISLNADIYCLQEIHNINSFKNLAEDLIEYDYVISNVLPLSVLMCYHNLTNPTQDQYSEKVLQWNLPFKVLE